MHCILKWNNLAIHFFDTCSIAFLCAFFANFAFNSHKMHKALTVLLLAITSFTACKKKPDDAVADAMKHYTEINNKQNDYKQKRVDDLTSAASGTITGYYRDEEVKKIVAEHFSDTCRTFTEYYFDEGMLIFIIQQNFVYNKPRTYTEEKAMANGDSVWYDDKKTRLDISRFFFSNNKLIKWFKPDNKEVPSNTWAFTNKETGLWAETIVLIKELKEQ